MGKTSFNDRAKGIGLIELMVASSLALLLLAIAARIYQQYQQTYRYQQSLATIQENGRTAIHILQYGLRTAGYGGCSRLLASTELAIAGYYNGETTSLKPIPREYVRYFLPHTDAVVIRQMQTQTVDLIVPAKARQRQIKISDHKNFKEGDSIIVADCVNAEINQVKQLNTGQIFLEKPLSHDFSISAEVGRLAEYVFYVGDTGRKNSLDHPIFALYQLDLGRSRLPSEVIEGIESMKISYGMQGRYLSAQQISNWAQVESMKITLVISSITPPILKREWHTYVALRNSA